jgi:hypothetical protein
MASIKPNNKQTNFRRTNRLRKRCQGLSTLEDYVNSLAAGNIYTQLTVPANDYTANELTIDPGNSITFGLIFIPTYTHSVHIGNHDISDIFAFHSQSNRANVWHFQYLFSWLRILIPVRPGRKLPSPTYVWVKTQEENVHGGRLFHDRICAFAKSDASRG